MSDFKIDMMTSMTICIRAVKKIPILNVLKIFFMIVMFILVIIYLYNGYD